MGEAKRRGKGPTIGEYVGQKPGEPLIVRIYRFFDLLAEAAANPTWDTADKMGSMCELMEAANDKSLECALCRKRLEHAAQIGNAGEVRNIRMGPKGAPFAACIPCSEREDFKEALLAKHGEYEIKGGAA